MFVNMDFQALKLKFHSCNFKQAFHPPYKLYITLALTARKYFYTCFSFNTWLSNPQV